MENEITIEQYNEAVKIINSFHEQINKKIACAKKIDILTVINENPRISTLLKNVLYRLRDTQNPTTYYDGKTKYFESIYFDDLNENIIKRMRGVGFKTLREFIELKQKYSNINL